MDDEGQRPRDDLADYQSRRGDRGVYDERNRVNDLTGKEWKVATKSVIDEPYPPDFQFDLRRAHGGQKPPRLCRDLIERFSKAGDRVLDPYAGVGGTLAGASLCADEGTGLREALGFELNPEWVERYEAVMHAENEARAADGEPPLATQELRQGDCLDLIDDVDEASVDFLLTDPPYWTMDSVEQTRNDAETRASGLDAFNDREPTSKDEWLAEMRRAFSAFERVLVPDAYVAVFIGDMYRESAYHFLSAELAAAIDDATDLTLKASLVWYDPAKPLHVYGYPYAWVPSMVHQNVLVFRAE